MHIKLVTDSSSDMLEFSGIPFAAAPLKIITPDKLKLISDMRKRNTNAGLIVFWVRIPKNS